MSPRIYQLCREAITYMATEQGHVAKRLSKAYLLFLIHISPADLPADQQHHLLALHEAFEDEVSKKVGVTKLSDTEANTLARHAVDLFTGVADHFHGNN